MFNLFTFSDRSDFIRSFDGYPNSSQIMKIPRLAPYILVSILIHAGALLGIHRFLIWPRAEKEETEILVPVEIAVVPGPSDAAEPGLAPDARMPDPIGLPTGSQKMTAGVSGRLKSEPIDPTPLLSNLQPKLSDARMVIPIPTLVSQAVTSQTGSAGAGATSEASLSRPTADARITAVPPVAGEHIEDPRVRVRSTPVLGIIPGTLEGKEIIKGATVPASQNRASDIADLDALPPPGSLEPAVKLVADLQAAEATSGFSSIRLSQSAAAAPADTLSPDQTITGLHVHPTTVSDEPRMIVATLQLNSQPGGAQVFVDDLPSGETPLEMELPVGKHEFRLVLPGHYDWKAQIELTERNKPYPIFSRLLPIE